MTDERRCINLYSDMNPWMDLVLLIKDKDDKVFEKAKEVVNKAFDDFWNDPKVEGEMIKKGFKNGIISVEDDYAGCLGICCKIGDNAFYFLGSEDDSITKEAYWKSYTLNMTIDMIFDILKSAKSAEENGLDDWEIGYYESVLK